ncbi:MAG: DUF2155 domain-containing protein [Alphaproteobacteria bacterium]
MSIRKGILAAVGAGVLMCGPAALAQEDDGPTNIPQKVAVLRGLDKTTARVNQMAVEVGKPFRFGALKVVVRACMARPPEEPPEHTAFLDVTEISPAGEKSEVFKGWVFASTPALNAVEHPVYDVWLIKCRGS